MASAASNDTDTPAVDARRISGGAAGGGRSSAIASIRASLDALRVAAASYEGLSDAHAAEVRTTATDARIETLAKTLQLIADEHRFEIAVQGDDAASRSDAAMREMLAQLPDAPFTSLVAAVARPNATWAAALPRRRRQSVTAGSATAADMASPALPQARWVADRVVSISLLADDGAKAAQLAISRASPALEAVVDTVVVPLSRIYAEQQSKEALDALADAERAVLSSPWSVGTPADALAVGKALALAQMRAAEAQENAAVVSFAASIVDAVPAETVHLPRSDSEGMLNNATAVAAPPRWSANPRIAAAQRRLDETIRGVEADMRKHKRVAGDGLHSTVAERSAAAAQLAVLTGHYQAITAAQSAVALAEAAREEALAALRRDRAAIITAAATARAALKVKQADVMKLNSVLQNVLLERRQVSQEAAQLRQDIHGLRLEVEDLRRDRSPRCSPRRTPSPRQGDLLLGAAKSPARSPSATPRREKPAPISPRQLEPLVTAVVAHARTPQQHPPAQQQSPRDGAQPLATHDCTAAASDGGGEARTACAATAWPKPVDRFCSVDRQTYGWCRQHAQRSCGCVEPTTTQSVCAPCRHPRIPGSARSRHRPALVSQRSRSPEETRRGAREAARVPAQAWGLAALRRRGDQRRIAPR
jgi:hypothetical protein